MLGLSVAMNAQGLKVSGVVTDVGTGEGIPFASVIVKGTMNGVSTDADGSYSISGVRGKTLCIG